MTRYLAYGAWLSVVVASSVAHAHPLRFGVLTLKELGSGQFDLQFRFDGSETDPAGVEPVVPAHCEVTRIFLRAQTSDGVHRIERIDCGSQGLIGHEVGVQGIQELGTQVRLEVRWQDGTRTDDILEASATSTMIHSQAPIDSVFGRYLVLGVEHILIGIDHLMFVLGLLLLVRSHPETQPAASLAELHHLPPSARARNSSALMIDHLSGWELVRSHRRLVTTITAFTLGHSLTLALSILDIVRAPQAATEAGIALSILLLAVELTRANEARPTWTLRRPELVAMVFGLLHGLGFAGALRETGLVPGEVPATLFAFNLGVETGQLLFVAAALLIGGIVKQALRERPAWMDRTIPYALGAWAAFLTIDRIVDMF